MRLQIQQLRVDFSAKTVSFSLPRTCSEVLLYIQKEVSRLKGIVNAGVDNQDTDSVSMSCPASPMSLKWDGFNGSFTPLTTHKRTSKV